MTQPANKSEVAAAYDEWAEMYDTDLNRTRELAAEIVRRIDIDLFGRDVIEIGCGTGYNTQWLAERAATIVALDFSEGMLLQARARAHDPRVRFIQHDVRDNWPLPDASADLLIGMLILEHVEHLEPIFAEASRTLRAEGELFICELHPMRQLLGRQAEFTNIKTGELHRVRAYLHNVSDYVNAGLSAGFELLNLAEWRDANARAETPPRLLSLRFRIRWPQK